MNPSTTTQHTRPFALLTPSVRTLNPPKRQKLPKLPPTPPVPSNISSHPRPAAVSMAAPSMDIISPASPMALRLTSDVNKAATVFRSHVRRTFQRFPVDYTGELVRLLDDITTFTCTMGSAVSERSSNSHLSSDAVTRQFYRVMAHDGYCCIILAKGLDQPLTFDDSVLHGNYVVCVSPLDMDHAGSDQHSVAGMLFSVYKRKSSTSLPGRGIDLQQSLSDQVAAGYASFASATTLYYTMGHGVYSFVLHPVALQYFLQPAMRLSIPENPTLVYADRALLRNSSPISSPLAKLVDKYCASMLTTGCLVSDVHHFMQTGGVLIADSVHLMCEAAPIAFVVEQSGGTATDEFGERILDMSIVDDYNVPITLVLGTPSTHGNLTLTPAEPMKANGKH